MECPLCFNNEVKTNYYSQDNRLFYLCNECSLIFCDRKHLPGGSIEKKRYLEHKNDPNNKGYRNFLLNAISPFLKFAIPGMKGIDYGCGSVPALSMIINEYSITCDYFDPIFFPDINCQKYDFVFSTECFEHFHYVFNDLSKIISLMKKNAFLIIMTEFWTNPVKFSTWYYSRDITHVSFYHINTIHFICNKFGFKIEFNDNKRVVILKRIA